MRNLGSDPVTEEVQGAEIVSDAGTLAATVHEALKTGRSGLLPDLLDEVARGDTLELANLVASQAREPDPQRLVVYWATVCTERWGRCLATCWQTSGGARTSSQTTCLRGCVGGRVRSLPLGHGAVPDHDDPLISEVPVLLLNGTEDPQDPPANVADASTELPNSLLVEVPGQGHGVGVLGCLRDGVTAFIEAGSVEALDVSCVADIESVRFAGVEGD